MYFPANFVKFSRMSFLQNTSGRLLLHVCTKRLFFTKSFCQRLEEVYSLRNSGVLVQGKNSEHAHFSGYSITQENISIYQATVRSRTPQFPRQRNIFLTVHLILPVSLCLQENRFSRIVLNCGCTIQNTSNSQAKTHLRTPFLQNNSQ